MRPTLVHRMHLKGPWNYEWLDGSDRSQEHVDSLVSEDSPLLTGSRIRMPSSWQSAFGETAGRIRFSRRFQRPTNLDADEQVHIAFDGIGGAAVLFLNNVQIGQLQDSEETVSFDITAGLKASNELTVELTYAPQQHHGPGGLHRPVAIEIHTEPGQRR